MCDRQGLSTIDGVCFKLCELIQDAGGEVRTSTQLQSVSKRNGEIVVETNNGTLRTSLLINCAGLQSDRIARMCGHAPEVKIVPFRGEYFELTESAQASLSQFDLSRA